MKKNSFILSVVLMMMLLMIVTTATGEYYQYTDPDGTVRFTDDPSLIPSNQREETQVYESVVSYPAAPEPVYRPTEEEDEAAPADASADVETASADAGTPPPNREARVEADELNAMREQLIKAYKELGAAKNALGPPPPENAKSGVKGDYVQMSRELNLKIEAYNQMSNEFDEKVKEFNSRVMKK